MAKSIVHNTAAKAHALEPSDQPAPRYTPGPWICSGIGCTKEYQSVWKQTPFMQESIAQFVTPANARLIAQAPEMARLIEKALTRSAIVHPGFADEIRAVLAKL